MPATIISQSNTLTLIEVVTRLARHPSVEGVLLIGSASRDELSPASDYDLLMVLRDMPVPLRVAVTYVDQRLTDVIFVATTELEGVAHNGALTTPPIWEKGRLAQWLRTGRILHDRGDLIRSIQAAALGQGNGPSQPSEIYSAWFSINYNLTQNDRYLAADDPAYRMALDLRLLFSLHDLWRYYFLLRGASPQGEKAQYQFLADHDPGYLELFQRCLAEHNRETKCRLYKDLARLTVGPLGGLWPEGSTAILPEPGPAWDEHTSQAALSFWESLLQ